MAERRERLRTEAELRRAEALLTQAFTRQPDAMLLVERGSQRLRDANPAAAELLGLPLDALIDQPLQVLQPRLAPDALAGLRQALDQAGQLQAVPLQVLRPDGQRRDTLVSVDTLRLDGVDHAFVVAHDISDQLAHDDELRRTYDNVLAQQTGALQADLDEARAQAWAARADADQARQARETAERRLHEFTRGVSHDLRTPLSAVQGFAGLLRQRLRDGRLAEAEACSGQIERAARRMAAMVDALQRLARLGSTPLRRQPLPMRQLVDDTLALLRQLPEAAHTELRIDTLPDAEGDPDLVAQVWQNLLGNALKYSSRAPQPRVRVDSHQDARGLWFRVTDNGVGYDMAQAGDPFQPFQRMASAQDFEGSGIGLSLVRRIVELHGGEARLRSAPGVGTVAEFTLTPSAPG